MKTILVPTDFSKDSEHALRTGAAIAEKNNASLLVLHMVGIEDAFLTKEQSNNAMEAVYYLKLAEQQFADFLDKPYLENVEVNQVIMKHRNFTEINQVVQENNIDLIVMASKGSSGLKELLIGSNTEKVIRFSDVPVLVIKEAAPDFALETGVFASDFDSENVGAYLKTKAFFEAFNIEMKLVYVNTPNFNFKKSSEIDELLYAFFIGAGYDNPNEKLKEVTIVSDYTVEEGVFAFSNLTNADIIAIPTHGRKGLSHLIYGSISEDVANHAKIPVLTVKI